MARSTRERITTRFDWKLPLAILAATGLLAAPGAPAQVFLTKPPYVPTPQSTVDRMLELARVGPDDFVIDLGSGDGRIVITAAKKYGARGFGVDIDPQLVALANANARAAAVDDRAQFYERDLFETDLSDATVVTIYLLKRATMKLRSRLLALKPGTRIVSHAASMGDSTADHFELLDVKDRVRPDAPGRTYIHFWIVPAKVAGTWRWSMPVGGRMRDYEFTAVQEFQTFSGTVRVGGTEARIEGGRLTGERVTLAFSVDIEGAPVQHRFAGRVAGDSIIGTVSLGSGPGRGESQWNAVRATSPHGAARILRGKVNLWAGPNVKRFTIHQRPEEAV